MSNVIDLNGRKKIRKELRRSERLHGLRSILQCTRCAMRCGKCGVQGEITSHVTHPATGISFKLCAACLDEYSDLQTYLGGDGTSDLPSWCNREWVRQWLAWLDYQLAMTGYVTSPEVLAVLAELRKE